MNHANKIISYTLPEKLPHNFNYAVEVLGQEIRNLRIKLFEMSGAYSNHVMEEQRKLINPKIAELEAAILELQIAQQIK